METSVHQAPRITLRKRKRRKPFIKIAIILGILLILGYLALFFVVLPERPDYPFFQGKSRPLAIAYRGGMSMAPENTLVAFQRALDVGADVIHMDLQLSKDGHLVAIHHDTVDQTTDGEGRVAELTLEELKKLDAAYRFQDIRGHYIYRSQGITIPTLEEVLEAFPQTRLWLEVIVPEGDKENESGGYGPGVILEGETVERAMARILWDTIERYGREDFILVSSENDRFIEAFQRESHGKVPVAAGQQERMRFIFFHKLYLDRLYRPKVDVMVLPASYAMINLEDERLIKGGHRYNMPVIYWDITDENVLRNVLVKGADGVVTAKPDLVIRILNEMEEFDGHR